MKQLDLLEASLVCFRATLGDVALTLAAYLAIALAACDVRWALRPTAVRLAAFTAIGIGATILLELHAIGSGRWVYGDAMPACPCWESVCCRSCSGSSCRRFPSSRSAGSTRGWPAPGEDDSEKPLALIRRGRPPSAAAWGAGRVAVRTGVARFVEPVDEVGLVVDRERGVAIVEDIPIGDAKAPESEFGHGDFAARERRVERPGEAAHGAIVEEEENLRAARPQRRRSPPP